MDEIDPKELRKNLKSESDYTIFQRGQNYYRQGRAISISFSSGEDEYPDDISSIEIKGKVRGSRTYESRLTIYPHDNTILDYECNCPYDRYMCKHVVALGLQVADNLEKENLKYKVDQPGNTIRTVEYAEVNTEQESLLKKLSELGIDPASLPQSMIGQLVAAIPKSTQAQLPIKIDTTKPKPKKPFNERYYLHIQGYQDHLIDRINLIESKKQYYHYSEDVSINKILANETDLELEIAEMLKMIKKIRNEPNYKNKNQDIDIVKILIIARSKNIAIRFSRQYYNAGEILTWQDRDKIEKLSMKFSEEKDTSAYGSYNYSFIKVDFLESLSIKNSYVVAGEQLVVINTNRISFYDISFIVGNIASRAVKDTMQRLNEYPYKSQYNKEIKKDQSFNTILTGTEYLEINNILNLCKTNEHIRCILEIKDGYNIVEHQAKPIIVIDYESDKSTLSVLPSVDYGGVVLAVTDTTYFSNTKQNSGVVRRVDPAFGDSHIVRILEDNISISKVDTAEEKKLFNLGRVRGDELGIRGSGRVVFKGQKQIANFIQQYLPKIKKLYYEIAYPHDIPKEIINAEFKADFDIDFNIENDWLAFDLALYCGDERVQLTDIENCLNNSDGQVTMKDGRILRITNPEALKRLIELLAHFRKNNAGSYEGKSYHAPELEAVAKGSPHYKAITSKAFSSFIQEAKQGKLVKSLKIPKVFQGVLRDYQIEGVHWLHFLHTYRFAGVLADDMGLGKTLQALVILSIHSKKYKPSLIIVPKTLLHNWEQEVKTFAPHLKTIIIDGTQPERSLKIKNAKKYDLLITSYPALQRDIEVYEKYKLCFNYTVLDEAQYVKNPHTKSSHMVRRVKSDYRLALTGTPLENGVLELWAQFDFLMPGFLGHHTYFQKHLGNPIMKHSDTFALERLRTKVKCFMLRRTKEEVLKELPPKIEQVTNCELSDEQNILYQDVLKRVRNEISAQVEKAGFAASQIHILAGLTRLRQICNHPALVLPPKKKKVYPSAKLDECMEIIRQIQKEKRKILVFSSFTKMLDILGSTLEKENIKYTYLSGQTKDRKSVVDSFNTDPDITVFLISTKVGGIGLNLTVADAVIIFDPWWNPQVERQAIDRTHRIGQTKSVNVYRLRTKGTIEEKIIALQERKQNLFNALVDDSKDLFKKLTWEDVKSLLT